MLPGGGYSTPYPDAEHDAVSQLQYPARVAALPVGRKRPAKKKKNKQTKDAMWSRWTAEYLRALRERHRLKHGDKKCSIAVGDVVIIKSSERNRNSWPLGIVERLIEGRDGAVRGARMRAGRSHIQHLYLLELSCEREDVRRNNIALNPAAPGFRHRRDAAVAAGFGVRDLGEQDQLE